LDVLLMKVQVIFFDLLFLPNHMPFKTGEILDDLYLMKTRFAEQLFNRGAALAGHFTDQQAAILRLLVGYVILSKVY